MSTPTLTPSAEGFVKHAGYQTWYAVYGDLASGNMPLLVLHGGPGYAHNYLQNLSELSRSGRPVIFYDQLGCGNSERPSNPSLWTVDFYLEELNAIIDALGLTTFDLLGSSWGGSLAIEYALQHPAALRRLVLHSPLLDTKLWVEEADRLKDLLPPDVAATMRQHEDAGTTNSTEYADAYAVFRNQFLCRVEPYPDLMRQSDEAMSVEVYETMWGPSEAHATGNLKNWSSLDRLPQIAVPTLFISGEHDEATPKQMEIGHKLIPNSQWTLLANCSHSSNLEDPAAYFAAVEGFLTAVE